MKTTCSRRKVCSGEKVTLSPLSEQPPGRTASWPQWDGGGFTLLFMASRSSSSCFGHLTLLSHTLCLMLRRKRESRKGILFPQFKYARFNNGRTAILHAQRDFGILEVKNTVVIYLLLIVILFYLAHRQAEVKWFF